MKIDLIYPKIPENTNKFLTKCHAFEKLDGTNMHWKWDPQKDGWSHFGTRRTQFLLNKEGINSFAKEHSELANAPYIFNDILRDKLTQFICTNSIHNPYHRQNILIFTEFYGPNSFAGSHDPEDARLNTQTLSIIDIMINDQMISPQQLVEDFKDFDLAKLVYMGKYSGQFAEDVRNGKYNVNEGVVVKGVVDGQLFMTKIKTNDYLKRLQQNKVS